jgi:mRNA interferase RelE/StbE
VAAYTVDVRPRARRSLRQSVQKAIARVIDGLTTGPRPAGCLPLTGQRPYLRVRSGDYRVIYTVDDSARVVTIAPIRRLFARLPQSAGHALRSAAGRACGA